MLIRTSLLCGCLLIPQGMFATPQTPENPTSPGSNNAGAQRQTARVTPPQLISSVNPEYPEWARSGKHPIQGTYVVGLIVDEEGRTRDVHIIRSPDKRLDEMALDAVKQWTFKPAMKGDKPVAVQLTVGVDFVLLPKDGSSGK